MVWYAGLGGVAVYLRVSNRHDKIKAMKEKKSTAGQNVKEISWLGVDPGIPGNVFGSKAATLDRLKAMVPVADGFAISAKLVRAIGTNTATPSDVNELTDAVEQLGAKHKKLIVRSSSVYEDRVGHQFAGIFESVSDVAPDKAMDAILAVYASGSSQRAQTYNARLGLDLTAPHVAVLVQAQIETTSSGIAQDRIDHLHAEIWQGALAKGARGREAAAEALTLAYTGISKMGPKAKSSLTVAQLKALRGAVKICAEKEGRGCIIEFGFAGPQLFIFQVRPQERKGADFRLALSATHGGNLKAAAMEYFATAGLFTKPLAIVPPSASEAKARKIIESVPFGSAKLTVRFAHNEELGLPRRFCSSKQEAVECVLQTRRPGWSAIVHDYISLRRSFELMVEQDVALLEHVPGMWESDSKIAPDQLVIHGDRYQCRIARKNRQGRLSSIEDNQLTSVRGIDATLCRLWAKRLHPVLEKVRKDYAAYLPLNFHFIEDDEGHWLFLNIRPGFQIPNDVPQPKTMFPIRRLTDLESWNGKTAVRLSVDLNRGEEHSLTTLAQELARRNAVVFTEFGVLSHPAMVMREFGVVVHAIAPARKTSGKLGTIYLT